MTKNLLSLITFFIFTFPTQAQTDKVKQIDSLMQAAHHIGVFNGNVLVAQKGKIIYQSAIGYADGSKTKMLSQDLQFDIGSISKEFNGAAIMLLKERGKLNLDDKVSKYLPDLPQWAQKIRIRHLLQYTSGLPNTRAESDDEISKELQSLEKLEFEPGTAYTYSYNNVYLQRRIIEKLTGLPYKDFVESNIFKPCGMLNAAVDLPLDSQGIARAFDNSFMESNYKIKMTGLVRLTIQDLYKWIQCLHAYKIVNETSFKELAEHFGEEQSSLGDVVYENKQVQWHRHHGSNFNYEAFMLRDAAEDITVILLTNNQNFKVGALTEAILAILKDQPYTVPKKSVYLDLREKVLDNFEAGIAFYNEIKETQQDKYDFSAEVYDLYSTGKYLMRRNRFEDAIRIFHLSTLTDLSNTGGLSYAYGLIGESYLKQGNRQMAIIYYRKAAALDNSNKSAQGMLDEMLSKK